MKLWVSLPGAHDAEVELHADTVGTPGRVWIEVEGQRLEADFHALPDGEVYSLIADGRSHEVRVVARDPQSLEVTLDNLTIPVEVRHPLEKLLGTLTHRGGTPGEETISAPMPGVVVAFRVAPGDRVAAGQPVVVVEAMKMQNELAARHGGVVRELLVAERAAVAAGQPLVRLAAES
jgi:biotin carboxyl carrier protein